MKKGILALLVIFILALSIFTGCQDDGGLTADERIKQFVSDLNKDRNKAYKDNCATGSPLQIMGNKDYADNSFGTASNLSVSSTSGPNTSKTVIISNSKYVTYIFTMKNEGKDGKDDWYITNHTP
ncbi:MAG: hypothetical protein FWE72_05440 [Spirochaetaceae bacterium]|nr:hypothetical protein [Spirochaetaceae bacterium]